MIVLRIFLCLNLLVFLFACNHQIALPKLNSIFTKMPEEYTEPPVYMRIFENEDSPLLSEKVNVNFPPGSVVLQTAIVSGLPFPVTVIPQDDYVNLQTVVAVQAHQVDVASYLKQLEGVTGYRIELQPDDRIVEVSSVVTKTWNLAALSGIGKFNARLGFEDNDESGDKSKSSGEGYAIHTELAHDDDVWDSIVSYAQCVLGIQSCQKQDTLQNNKFNEDQESSDHQAWLVENRRIGTITAGGKPIKIGYLDEWLQQLSEDSLYSVQLDCTIFDIAKNQDDSFGVDLEAVFGDDSLIQIQSAVSGAESLNPWLIGALVRERDFDIDLFIRSLSETSNAEVKSRVRLSVTNGATAYINTGEIFSYISDTETIISEGIATTGFTQQRLQVGLELAITPRVIDKSGRILVEVIPILSSLLGFDTLNSGGEELDTPVITLRQLSSQAITRDGYPIVIGGLDLDRFSHTQSGISKRMPFHRLLSSEEQGYESRQLLIVITPRLIRV